MNALYLDIQFEENLKRSHAQTLLTCECIRLPFDVRKQASAVIAQVQRAESLRTRIGHQK